METTTQQISFPQIVRVTRMRKGWTKKKLAALSGIQRTHLGRIESGLTKPRPETISKIEAALNLVRLPIAPELDAITTKLIHMLKKHPLMAEYLLVSAANDESAFMKSYREFVDKTTTP